MTMQYNQSNHANTKSQKIILKPPPSLNPEINEAKRDKNTNVSLTTHNVQKTQIKKQRQSIDRKTLDICCSNYSKDLEQILKQKLTITEYPDFGTDQSRNFITTLSKHKKMLTRNTKKDQIRQSTPQNDLRKVVINLQRINKDRNKVNKQYEQFLNQKITTGNKSRSCSNLVKKKLEQQPYMEKTSYSNMFRSQTTGFNKKKKVKILVKTYQNKQNTRNIKVQNKFQIKSITPLPKKNPILEENKHHLIYKSASGLYDSIQRTPNQFLHQYLKHKKQRQNPELKQKKSINISHQQQKILLQIRQYVQKNYNKDQFCNYYSAHLSTQNEFRVRVKSKHITNKNKKQKQVETEQDQQGIEAWKQINNEVQTNFMKSTGLRRLSVELQEDQIIQFMQREKF